MGKKKPDRKMLGSMVTINQTIDQDTAELLVEEFGHNIQRVSESDVDIDTAEILAVADGKGESKRSCGAASPR